MSDSAMARPIRHFMIPNSTKVCNIFSPFIPQCRLVSIVKKTTVFGHLSIVGGSISVGSEFAASSVGAAKAELTHLVQTPATFVPVDEYSILGD